MSAAASKALAAWTELNDRQQGTLAAIYAIDQDKEAARRIDAARGDWSDTPAAIWRRIDFSYDPGDRKLWGITELQARLEARGWDNQGNGSTMAALAARGLITRGSRSATLTSVLTVTLTRDGRAAARAGLSLSPGGTPKAALGRRAWEVLTLLWTAGQSGKRLNWGYSATIEKVLMGKHIPPLAQLVPGGYEITDRGRDFYREHYAAHTAAHPDVNAPHPDGVDAEPWPARADEILTQHRDYYRALSAAWRHAHDMHLAADREIAVEPPVVPPILPAAVAEQTAARHRLWQDTARQRAELAAVHVDDLHQRGVQAARDYAAAALTVFRAAVTQADPLAALTPPAAGDDWDEPPLAPPAETGIHAIDAEAKKLHATAVGAPVRRRGPAPKHRRSHATRPADQPGAALAALADYLGNHTQDGALLRRLHPPAP
jgi:hypothetical protein